MPWMELGEAILAMFDKKIRSRLHLYLPPTKVLSKQAKKIFNERLERLQEILLTTSSGKTVAAALKWKDSPSAMQAEDDVILLLVATICYLRLGAWHPDSRLSVLCSILSCCMDSSTTDAITKIRFAVYSFIEKGVLSLHNDNVYLASAVANSLINPRSPAINAIKTLTGADEAEAAERAIGSQPKNDEAAAREQAKQQFNNFVKNIVAIRPAVMNQMLTELGYVGQEQARRAICVAAYRHVRRLQAIHLDGIKVDQLPKRDCLMLIGPSGCGKTHLLELAFEKILKIPFTIFDSGSLSETAYQGAKLDNILLRLLQSANGNLRIAECGIICLDEIDKIAGTGTADGTAPGESLNRDVAGSGTQKTLLKMLEGSVLNVSPSSRHGDTWTFDCRNNLIIGSGAFSALHHRRHQQDAIGFGSGNHHSNETASFSTDDLVRYGLQAEFVGRFSSIIQCNELGRDSLIRILLNIVARHRAELELENIGFEIEDDALEFLVKQAMERKTGARALSTCLSDVVQNALFDAYSQNSVRGLRLFLDGDKVSYEIVRRPQEAAATIRPEFDSVCPPPIQAFP